MKQVINNKDEGTVTVVNLLKRGFKKDRVIAYKRHNNKGLEEYAFLRRLTTVSVGFVSLIGGPDYGACLTAYSYSEAIRTCSSIRNLYVFKDLEDFLKNKHKMTIK